MKCEYIYILFSKYNCIHFYIPCKIQFFQMIEKNYKGP